MAFVSFAGCSRAKKAKPTESTDHPDRIRIVDRKVTAKASVVKEVEPNNTVSAATPVSVGNRVHGSLNGVTDADYYKLSVAKPGLLSAQLTGIAKVDLVLELRDGADKSLARSDRGPANTLEGLPNYPVKKGDYFIVVREFVKKRKKQRRRRKNRRRHRRKAKNNKPARTGPSPNYELSLTMTDAPASSKSVEVEPNDKVASAVELKPGVDGVGYIGWDKDRDVWKLLLDEVTGDDVINVDVAGVSGVRLIMEILDVDGKRMLRRWGSKGNAVIVRGMRPKSGHEACFVRLFARRSQPGENYSVRFSVGKPDPSDEVEPNDRVRASTSLLDGKATTPPQTGGLRRGYLTRGDVDYYKLPKRAQPMALTVSISPPAEVDAVLFVLDGKGQQLAKADAGKRGARESTKKLRIPANTKVVIKVSGNGDSKQPERYELRWSVEVSSATLPPPANKTPKKKSGDGDLDDEYGN